jgi:hypothetical protein
MSLSYGVLRELLDFSHQLRIQIPYGLGGEEG